MSQETGTRLGAGLIRLGLLGERERADALSANYGLETLPQGPVFASDLVSDLNLAFGRAHRCMPVSAEGGVAQLAMAYLGDLAAREALASAVKGAMTAIATPKSAINAAKRA